MCVRFESKSCVYRKEENWKEVNIMEDARIVQLYWDRDEQAIPVTPFNSHSRAVW